MSVAEIKRAVVDLSDQERLNKSRLPSETVWEVVGGFLFRTHG
jgi:hypothetical protein